MNKWRKPSFRLATVLLAIIAVVAAAMGISRLTELPLEPVAGGTYAGELPGLGKVQFDLFLSKPWSASWLHREGFGNIGYGAISTNASGEFRADVFKDHDDATNATLTFKLTANGSEMHGVVVATNLVSRPFTLTRLYEHCGVHKHSGLLFHRLGAYADASSQIPLLPTNSAFDIALNRKIAQISRRDVHSYTSGNFQRQWEILRYGPSFAEGEFDDLWQVRLLTGSVASFAIWHWGDWGGSNGNLTSWRCRNFWWHNGGIRELKLPDLFQSGVDWKAQVRQLCCEDLERQQYTSESRAVLEEDISENQFTVSTTGMQIYFNPYSLASGADGEYIVHIPYKLLQPYLRPEWFAALAPSLASR